MRNPGQGDDGEWGTSDDDYGDLHLTVISPCLDQGDPSASGDTDMDGETRIIDGDGDGQAVIDMGADEFLDTDQDGLPDIWEEDNGLDPNDGDSDDDGLTDGDEVNTYGTDPILADSDSDGMPDGWEVRYGLNALVNDVSLDPDKDGYTNLQEYKEGGDPHSSDTPFPWELFYPAFLGD